MKKDLMYSLTVLFTVANGILGAMTIGITELIKYSGDDTVNLAEETMSIDPNVLGDMHLVGCSLKANKGWIFVILMCIGIIAFITMNIYDYQQKKSIDKI